MVVSCVVSIGIGRLIKHFLDKKRNAKREKEAREREAQTWLDRTAEPDSKNRSKRKRQLQKLQQLQQHEKKGASQAR